MRIAIDTVQFAFAIGEEVVVHLSGVEVYNVDEARRIPAACVPSWTIGDVVGRVALDTGPHYALSFPSHGATCICLSPDAAIEGAA